MARGSQYNRLGGEISLSPPPEIGYRAPEEGLLSARDHGKLDPPLPRLREVPREALLDDVNAALCRHHYRD